ncbi:MAG: glycosyltransferase family 4 protein [Saprospiraceae bacterium]|nr:glycosyltransferase family 4 protein [Saprospiraceae bacterium]
MGLTSALKKYNIDVFLSFDGFLSLSTSVPTVLVIHDLAYLHYPQHIPWIYRMYYRCFMPAFIRKAHTIVAVSEFTRNDILDKFGIKQAGVITATNALPSGFISAGKKGESPVKQPYFILPGSINPRKNTFAILKAFKRFNEEVPPETQRRLVVAGRFMWGKDAAMEKLWRQLTESDQLIHYAHADDAEMIQLISHAEAVLYVSLFEGFGIPLLEAMACGVPLITSAVSSMPEVAGEAALLVDPENEDQLVQAMKDIATKADLREKLIALGKERIKTFSWDKTATAIFQALEKAAASNK